ncbi:MAG: 30S ribosomal protein S9 [Phycisphaerae bacterium]
MTDQAPATHPAPAAPAAAKPPSNWIWGTGRRKTAVARVRVRSGKGELLINNRAFKDYFPVENLQLACTAPLRATQTAGKVDVAVNVQGGGPTGQAGAVSLGLARALVRLDTNLEPALRDGRYLTRDARKVERKKYGRAGARKRFQWTKR